MEKDLNELVERLKAAAGTNLKSVVLYGSAAGGDYHAKHSDLNVIGVVETLDAAALDCLREACGWWAKKGHPAPLWFTGNELHRAADVFAIEFLDIRERRRVVFGEDVFAQLDVPMRLHRDQVERELRARLLALRQSYLLAPQKQKALAGLMTGSFSTFATLFRHALLALGEQPPRGIREMVSRLGAILGFEPAPFHAILDVREGKREASSLEVAAIFQSYLAGVERVVDQVDRRFNGGH